MTDKQFVYLKHPVSQAEKGKYRKEGKIILDERFKPVIEEEKPNGGIHGGYTRNDLIELIVELGGKKPSKTATDEEVIEIYEALLIRENSK